MFADDNDVSCMLLHSVTMIEANSKPTSLDTEGLVSELQALGVCFFTNNAVNTVLLAPVQPQVK